MALRGQIESAAKTRGRRKVIAERIEYGEPEGPAHHRRRSARLIGSCGHVLAWMSSVPLSGPDPAYLARRLGRRMTCEHDDCKIVPKPPRESRESDCTFIIGTDPNPAVGRRCRSTAKWDTDMGALCKRHRDYLIDGGYLDEPGAEIAR